MLYFHFCEINDNTEINEYKAVVPKHYLILLLEILLRLPLLGSL